MVPTNLANTPLVSETLFNRVQKKLRERKNEYDKRLKHDDEFLSSPLFQCRKCGSKMYPRKGSGGRIDYYICGKCQRYHTCDEPTFQIKKLDDVVALKAVMYLTDPNFRKAKIAECMSEEHRIQAQENVATKQRIAVEIGKKLNRARQRSLETDDAFYSTEVKKLNLSLPALRAMC